MDISRPEANLEESSSDAVYQQAVRKLRMLLSASEAASMTADEGSLADAIRPFQMTDEMNLPTSYFTDPPVKPKQGRFAKNAASKAKRKLFQVLQLEYKGSLVPFKRVGRTDTLDNPCPRFNNFVSKIH